MKKEARRGDERRGGKRREDESQRRRRQNALRFVVFCVHCTENGDSSSPYNAVNGILESL